MRNLREPESMPPDLHQESGETQGENSGTIGSLRRSVLRVILGGTSILGIVSVFLGLSHGIRPGIILFLATLPLILAWGGFVLSHLSLVRSPGGGLEDSVHPANMITAVRIFLVAPVLLLLFYHQWMWGLVLYVAGAATDVLDGLIARRYDEVTVLGVILDPVGDILITAVVYGFFWFAGDFPLWVFVILMVRYGQFFIGLAVLRALGAEPELRATAAGKIVGVVQAAGIVILFARRIWQGYVSLDEAASYCYPAVGVAFTSVIISQTVIGWKALRKRGTVLKG